MKSQATAPAPAYVPSGVDSPIVADAGLYGPIGTDLSRRKLVSEFVIPVRSGRAWDLSAGRVCRLTTHEGPQVFDLNLWHRHDPRERFWAARTRQIHGAHLSTGDHMWSTLPFLRPLATIVADSVAYGIDADGAGCHDLLGTRCDPYVNQLLAGTAYDFHCHSNLTRAIAPFGLTEFDVHDVINVFQVTGLRADDELYFMKPSPAQPGDFFEIFAEVDLLLAGSTCPGGDLSVPLWGPEAGAEPICNPILVQTFEIDPSLLEGWRPPAVAAYAGANGMRHGYGEPGPPPPLTQAAHVD